VAAPVGWDELDDLGGANAFTVRDAALLIERANGPLASWDAQRQALPTR